MDKKQAPHYVKNAEFSAAIVEYCTRCDERKAQGLEPEVIPNYIAECFLKIAEGLSHRTNFSRYTFREEMVMDAVENCLKAIRNYNVAAATRTGKPNAFAYFTQISWYAFLRRIQKEKKEQDIKMKILTDCELEQFLIPADEDPESAQAIQSFVDDLRRRIDDVKEKDSAYEVKKKEVIRRRVRSSHDSDLTQFFDEDDDYES